MRICAWAAGAQKAAWCAAPGKAFPLVGGTWAIKAIHVEGDYAGQRDKLGGAWMVHVSGGEGGGNLQGTPVVNGVMYVPAGGGVILALDAATGATKWKYTATGGGRGPNRGVVAAEGKVFSSAAAAIH